MFSPALAHSLLAVIVIVSIVLMLSRPRGLPEVYWIGAGVLLLVVLRLVPLRLAWRAAAKGRSESGLQNHFLTYDGKLVLAGITATGIVLLTASALNWNLGLPTY